MTEGDHQSREWPLLNARIDHELQSYSRRGENYRLIDFDQGIYEQFVELKNFDLLQPDLLMRLQAILADFPDWSIEVNVLDHEDRTVWREMMVEITHDRIIDRLRHDLLPQHLRQMRFGTTIDDYNEEMAAKVRRLMRKQAERG
ncbi:hypothetical protein IP86_06940 [Rhodopseudomonas sp. AAP120]|uniref:hypothetical protein n=1 Tax=Rhodopseudomonas sp. AAP120 TaxID=1523430 RepID=UPI0006B9BC92|nr:hypothetical protein [Rhodopseudomonas sp. AAP120]KPG00388.1 hypothetical protein IP86_06940 [Rhodopseudomonas sp. AAP120]